MAPANDVETAAVAVDVQRVAGEQQVVVDVEHDAAPRVPGRRDEAHTVGHVDGLVAVDDIGGERRRGGVVGVDPDAGAELSGIALGVGDVVTMGQQDVLEPTALGDGVAHAAESNVVHRP